MKIQAVIECWYLHYWWISAMVFFLAGLLIHIFVFDSESLDQQQFSVLAGLVASYFGSIFFVQKQKLEQDRFVKELFVLFNLQYDNLRSELSKVYQANEVLEEHEITLQRYFNLCAEEYYFWLAGRIPTAVWGSWRAGMQFYIEKSHITTYAKKEVTDLAYYGLATELKLSNKK